TRWPRDWSSDVCSSDLVADAVLDEVTGYMIKELQRQRPDGLLLALHGAMVAESHRDADGEVLSRLRQALGPDFSIVVTFDLHGRSEERRVGKGGRAGRW